MSIGKWFRRSETDQGLERAGDGLSPREIPAGVPHSVERIAARTAHRLAQIVTDAVGREHAKNESLRREFARIISHFDREGDATSLLSRIERAEDRAWRMEVAANRAIRFLRHVTEFSKDEEIRERALGVVVDMNAIMTYTDRQNIEDMLERFPDWSAKPAPAPTQGRRS